MKGLVLLAILVGSVFAGPAIVRHGLQPISFRKPVHDSSVDFCVLCVQFSQESLNELVYITTHAGVISGCPELCQLLEQAVKVNSSLVEVVCALLCDVVGIQEFIKLVDKGGLGLCLSLLPAVFPHRADLDPVYFCELVRLCPVKDDGDAKITSLTVNPTSVPRVPHCEGNGHGKIDLVILTVDGIPVGQNQLIEPQQPGTYNTKWSVQAKPDPNCDPTQQLCEMWEVGNYQANVAICNGECGSSLPHSQVYDRRIARFSVVNS